jgi:hypothetical protein
MLSMVRPGPKAMPQPQPRPAPGALLHYLFQDEHDGRRGERTIPGLEILCCRLLRELRRGRNSANSLADRFPGRRFACQKICRSIQPPVCSALAIERSAAGTLSIEGHEVSYLIRGEGP